MRLILGGSEELAPLQALAKFGAPHVMLSYFYLRTQKDRGASLLLEAHGRGCGITISSGAYTFRKKYEYLREDLVGADGMALFPEVLSQQAIDQSRKVNDSRSREDIYEELEAYAAEYLEWLKALPVPVEAVAELDLDMLIGERIWDWRRRLAELQQFTVIYTPHLYWELERLSEMGASYIGFEAADRLSEAIKFFADYRDFLEDRQIKVHGWGVSSADVLQKVPFFSVDSTSWLMGSKYGLTFVYDGGQKMRVHGKAWKPNRTRLVGRCEELGVSGEAFVDDQSGAVLEWSAAQWSALSKEMESYNVNAYWLTPEERSRAVVAKRAEFDTALAVQRHDLSTHRVTDTPMLQYARFCNTCFLGPKCPAFQADSTCQLHTVAKVRGLDGVKEVLEHLLALQSERVNFAVFTERVQGVPLDDRVTQEMSALAGMARDLHKVLSDTEEVTIKARGKGLVASLFGNVMSKRGSKSPPDDAIDVTPKKSAKEVLHGVLDGSGRDAKNGAGAGGCDGAATAEGEGEGSVFMGNEDGSDAADDRAVGSHATADASRETGQQKDH